VLKQNDPLEIRKMLERAAARSIAAGKATAKAG
jgi:hypothetical protein